MLCQGLSYLNLSKWASWSPAPAFKKTVPMAGEDWPSFPASSNALDTGDRANGAAPAATKPPADRAHLSPSATGSRPLPAQPTSSVRATGTRCQRRRPAYQRRHPGCVCCVSCACRVCRVCRVHRSRPEPGKCPPAIARWVEGAGAPCDAWLRPAGRPTSTSAEPSRRQSPVSNAQEVAHRWP